MRSEAQRVEDEQEVLEYLKQDAIAKYRFERAIVEELQRDYATTGD